jgi:hypothetical protein
MKVQSKSPIDQKVSYTRESYAYDWPPLEKDQFLALGKKELAWKKYCGFMEFSIDEYNAIQKLLLKEQIEIAMHGALGQEIMGERSPETLEEFRRFTPLTEYADYRDSFETKKRLGTSENSLYWAESPDRNGQMSRIPLSLNTTKALVDDVITALILSSAGFKGDVQLEPLAKILISLREKAISEAMNIAVSQRLECDNLIDPRYSPDAEPFCNLTVGIEKGLKKGIDFIISEPDTVARLGENSGYTAIKSHVNSLNAAIIYRLFKAWLYGWILRRSTLAKDIWRVKGIVCCGERSSSYTERIERTWGVHPLEVYCAAETGFMAVQSWNKKGMTFIPYRNFYEFIPMREIEKEAAEPNYQPATVLMNELEPNAVYELVVTNFHGGPFLRYRIGDYLKVIALKDSETGINLPQFILCAKPEKKVAFKGSTQCA